MGRNTLTLEEQEFYKKELEKVDWALPGMEKFADKDTKEWITRFILEGDIVLYFEWVFWPTSNKGYLDSYVLKMIADFCEIQSKPFWDEYENYGRDILAKEDQLCLEELGSIATPTSITRTSVSLSPLPE